MTWLAFYPVRTGARAFGILLSLALMAVVAVALYLTLTLHRARRRLPRLSRSAG